MYLKDREGSHRLKPLVSDSHVAICMLVGSTDDEQVSRLQYGPNRIEANPSMTLSQWYDFQYGCPEGKAEHCKPTLVCTQV